jgi:hypothetical protein
LLLYIKWSIFAHVIKITWLKSMKGQNTLRETEKVRIKLENENVSRSLDAVKH